MLNSADIKKIRSLRDKKFRDELGLFTAEGEKICAEALAASSAGGRFEVLEHYTTEQIGQKTMERISALSSPSPELCVIRKPGDLYSMPQHLKKDGLYLALDVIRDPGNMGTILRIADWFGLDGVFAAPDSVDIFNPKVVQSTMGAIFRVDFHYCSIAELCSRNDAEVFGTFLEGENIYEAELSSDRARIIVTGNESNGISDSVSKACTRRLTIPSFAKGQGSESLNAAVATAITISEFKRR